MEEFKRITDPKDLRVGGIYEISMREDKVNTFIGRLTHRQLDVRSNYIFVEYVSSSIYTLLPSHPPPDPDIRMIFEVVVGSGVFMSLSIPVAVNVLSVNIRRI